MRSILLFAVFIAIAFAAHAGLPEYPNCNTTSKCVTSGQDCVGAFVCDPLATTSLYCDFTTYVGGTQKCQARKALGAACNQTSGIECLSGACNGSICVPAPTAAPTSKAYEGQDCNITVICQGPTNCYAGKCRRRLSVAENAACDGNLECQGNAWCNAGTCKKATKDNNIARCDTTADCDTTASQTCKCVAKGVSTGQGICFSTAIAFPGDIATNAACSALYTAYQSYGTITATNADAALAAYNCLKTCADYSLTPLVPSSLVSYSGFNGAYNTAGCTWTTPTNAPSCTPTTPGPTGATPTASASSVAFSVVLFVIVALFF